MCDVVVIVHVLAVVAPLHFCGFVCLLGFVSVAEPAVVKLLGLSGAAALCFDPVHVMRRPFASGFARQGMLLQPVALI